MKHGPLVGATDVHYDDGGTATAALVVCRDATFSTVVSEHVAGITDAAPYESGERELPCIRAVLALGPPLEPLVVDGYATLDPGRDGEGGRTRPRSRPTDPMIAGWPRP